MAVPRKYSSLSLITLHSTLPQILTKKLHTRTHQRTQEVTLNRCPVLEPVTGKTENRLGLNRFWFNTSGTGNTQQDYAVALTLTPIAYNVLLPCNLSQLQ